LTLEGHSCVKKLASYWWLSYKILRLQILSIILDILAALLSCFVLEALGQDPEPSNITTTFLSFEELRPNFFCVGLHWLLITYMEAIVTQCRSSSLLNPKDVARVLLEKE
jgi:fumarate reductase subunit C